VTHVACDEARHGEAIRAIFNEAIAHTTALYDYVPRTPEVMSAWFTDKRDGHWPIHGVEDSDGTLMGFASYGPFRLRPAYKYSVEHSIYVDIRYRRRGVGNVLLERLIESAQDQGYHTLVGGIDSLNAPSIAMHQRHGFTLCGTVREAGFKFGKWLDLEFYQLILPTPHTPTDG
jgi:L-amino acid N-acyltransferase